jgi:outer membrane protein assembly factor BamB
VLGDRQRGHFEPGSLIEQFVDAARTVEQRELGVTMKVNEVLISHWIGDRLRQGCGGCCRRSASRENGEPLSPKRGACGGREGGVTRYYNGVLLHRTPISSVGLVFFVALFFVFTRLTDATVTFPVEVKWSASLAAPPAFAPAFDNDQIYVSLRTNQLVALLIKDGSAVWSVECPMTVAPAAGDHLVYTAAEDLAEARSATDGRAQWRRPLPGRIASPYGLHWDTGWLFASTETGAFVALRAGDGAVIWQRDLGSPLSAPPAPTGDRLYLGLKDGRILALSLQTGDEIWTQKITESAAGILPVGDRVFVGGRDNQFHSLEAGNGDADWRYPTGADVLGLPVLDERRVYFIALDNILRAHDRNNGSMLWKQVLPMRPFTGPLLSGDTLIVPGVAAELHAYNARTGQPAPQPQKFVLKGAENEEMLLAAPPHLTSQDLLILVTRGGQVRGVGAGPATAPPTPDTAAPPPAGTPPATAPANDASPPPEAGAAGTTK